MRALPLVLALSLIGCAHKQVRDDAPGSGGGIGLDVARQTAVSMAMGGLGTPGLQSVNGGPNEHSSQDMTAKSITLSAATGANAVGVTTNGARIDFGAGASDYASSDGTSITFGAPLIVGAAAAAGIRAAGYGISNNASNSIGIGLGGSGIEYRTTSATGIHAFQAKDGSATFATIGPGSAGTITLAAGTGTATVTSGMRCVCTDTTANASVKCAVSGTTLTATGTGTDVIAYLCL